MLKFSCLSLVLLTTCSIRSSVAQSEHPLIQLQGTSRVLMVFSPDSNNAGFQRQLELIEHHNFELTERNTVVIPIAFVNQGGDYHYIGENLPMGSPAEETYARNRFHVRPDQFLIVLLNADGTEQLRSDTPLPIRELTAHLDVLPRRVKF
jgi:hypothetical protein